MKKINMIVIFGLLLLSSPQGLASEEDLRRAAELRPFIGDTAYNYIINGHLNLVRNCRMTSSSVDPDQEGALTRPTPAARVEAWTEVMRYGGEETTREANHGIKAYMRDSVTSESDFFKASFQFYQWLKTRDQLWNEEHRAELESPAPIQVIPDDHNIYQKALQFSGGNRYLALKVMTLYGHDNMENNLSEGESRDNCRWKIMDAVIPDLHSQLYQNGAINTVLYDPDQVEAGRNVATRCGNAFNGIMHAAPAREVTARTMFALCNDGYFDYQADYYHTIAGAFLACRGQIRDNASRALSRPLFGSLARVVDATSDLTHRLAIHQYKIARFREEVTSAEIPEEAREVLNEGLVLLAAYQSPFGSTYTAYINRTSNIYGPMVRAILKRYEHEIQFREYQSHTLGGSFGNRTCANLSTYSIEDSAEDVSDNVFQRRGGGADQAPGSGPQPATQTR